MSFIRWEPFNAMDDMLNRFPAWFGRWPRQPGALETSSECAPSVDISETEGEYLIRASLPGMKKDDVELTLADGMLTLSGERQQQMEQKDEKFHKVESFYGAFSRSFALPDAVEADAIRADSKDGVLTVHVPKTKVEIRKPTTIKVK
jgi:HSP20 family protein